MVAWAKRAVMAVAVLVVPGAFLALVAYASARALHAGWLEARRQANGGAVRVRSVLASVHLKDIVRQARLAA
jgi:hypothetical protein